MKKVFIYLFIYLIFTCCKIKALCATWPEQLGEGEGAARLTVDY